MHQPYCNLVLAGVHQESLLDYLSSLGCKSYVSPTINEFTAFYSLSLELSSRDVDVAMHEFSKFTERYAMSHMNETEKQLYKKYLNLCFEREHSRQDKIFDPSTLGSAEANTLKHYQHTPEGRLVCWANHLSFYFSCPVLAFYSPNDQSLWYYLSQDGESIDEYTTYAYKSWLPGNPFLLEHGQDINGGNAERLCLAFNQPDRVNEVHAILRHNSDFNDFAFVSHPFNEMLSEDLGFSKAEKRHWLLAAALGISPWWTVGMSYETVSTGDWLSYFLDLEHPLVPIGNEAEEQLKCTDLLSFSDSIHQQEKIDAQLAIDYAEKRLKEKGITILNPEYILPDFNEELDQLSEAMPLARDKIIPALRDLCESALTSAPFSIPGKFGVIENLATIVEALLRPNDSKMKVIGLSAMSELDNMCQCGLMRGIGPLWLKHNAILDKALNSSNFSKYL